MGQPAVAALAPLPFELVFSDGEPLETEWHATQISFLKEVMCQAMAEQGRADFYTGGNMFVYHSAEQAWAVRKGRPHFRGPDFFWVGGVEDHMRKGWVAWEEGGRLPDLIIELLSPSTAKMDRNEKKDLYAQVFRTREYFLVDPDIRSLEGFDLSGRIYQPKVGDKQGRLWSDQLGVSLGFWHGVRHRREADWVRLFRRDGSLIPTEAEVERLRAEAAEDELARLRALLEDRGQS